MLALVPEDERKAKFHPCPQCDGEGTWRPGDGPEPRPMTLTIGGERSISTPGDSMSYGPGDDVGWVHCGACHGTGWTTFGNRVGRSRSDRHGTPRTHSHCHWCGTGWQFVEMHGIQTTRGSGISLFCERCWQETTPEERLPAHYEHWVRSEKSRAECRERNAREGRKIGGTDPVPWPIVYAAVMHEGIFGMGYGDAPFVLA